MSKLLSKEELNEYRERLWFYDEPEHRGLLINTIDAQAEEIARLKGRIEKLRKSLEQAGQDIHSEFCGSKESPCCTRITNILMEAADDKAAKEQGDG